MATTEVIREMKVKALAPWFGGKRTLATAIVAELGKHTQYFEPFCGSMAVLMAKEPSQKETANDLHFDLMNLARVIQQRSTAEDIYDRLVRAPFSEDLLRGARHRMSQPIVTPADDDRSADVERAYWYFLASWMGRNGVAGTARVDYQLAVRWTKGGGSPTVRWRNGVESLPAWHVRLLNVVLLNRDAFDILPKFEDVQGTAIYIDSPYTQETRSWTKNGQGSKYLHEFSNAPMAATAGRGNNLFASQVDQSDEQDDHARLAKILCKYQHARIVVSYYDCPRVRELYDGWTFIDKTRQKHLHAQNGRGARKQDAPEVLILNGPSLAESAARSR